MLRKTAQYPVLTVHSISNPCQDDPREPNGKSGKKCRYLLHLSAASHALLRQQALCLPPEPFFSVSWDQTDLRMIEYTEIYSISEILKPEGFLVQHSISMIYICSKEKSTSFQPWHHALEPGLDSLETLRCFHRQIPGTCGDSLRGWRGGPSSTRLWRRAQGFVEGCSML